MATIGYALPYIIPAICVFLSFLFGVMSKRDSSRQKVKLLRYETLYIPIMQKLVAGLCWRYSPSTLSQESRAVFFELITNNSHLLGRDSAKLLPDYYLAFLNLLEMEFENPLYRNASEQFDKIFNNIIYNTLLEAQELSASLKYPNLPKTILELYETEIERNKQ